MVKQRYYIKTCWRIIVCLSCLLCTGQVITAQIVSGSTSSNNCFIPLDSSFTAIPRNDNGSFGPIALPFSYSFYDTSYNQVWINTNGSLSFTDSLSSSSYSPLSFPYTPAMVAGFLADVDTRNMDGGQIYYKLTATHLIVTWDKVGYFDNHADKLNTFQIVLTNGTDPILENGINTALNYKDMQWTTGDGFGGTGGFQGVPATAGVNRGNYIDFFLIGQFSRNDSSNYGINYLDDTCFLLNLPPIVSGMPPGRSIMLNIGDTINLTVRFTGPEVGQTVNTQIEVQRLCATNYTITNGAVSLVNLQIVGDTCNTGGSYIKFTATDNGTSAQTTIDYLSVYVNKFQQTITFNPPTTQVPASGSIQLNATASSGLPVYYWVVSGPGTIQGNTLNIHGAGVIKVRAQQNGNNIFYYAVPKDVNFCAGTSPTQTQILGDTVACINSRTYYSIYPEAVVHNWAIDGGIIEGDSTSHVITVRWTSEGSHTVSVSYSVDCGFTVVGSLAVQVINNPLSGTIINMLPANGSSNVAFPINFSWFPLDGALYYDLYIWPDSMDQPDYPAVWNIDAINYSVFDYGWLQYGQKYKWRVVAKNLCSQLASNIQTFTLRPPADLIVNSIQIPASGFSGQSFSVQWEVKNIGQGSTLNRQWIDRIYLSTDIILDQLDIALGSVGNISELPPGSSYTNSATFTLPEGLNNSYYAIVVTNAYTYLLYESNHLNNTSVSGTRSAIQLTPPPDLLVTSITSPSFAFSGQNITLDWRVTNVGTGPSVDAVWYDRVYISRDTALNTSTAAILGTFRHDGALNANGSYNQSQLFKLPEGIFGDYYFYVVTDILNDVYEHTGENNNRTKSDTINIILTPPIDLVVSALTIPLTASNKETITVSWKVKNEGGSATENRVWRDHVYLSKKVEFNADSSWLLTTSLRPNGLAPGEEYTQQRNCIIPNLISGEHYIYVITDLNNQVYEYIYENNNIRRSDQKINILSSDLIVSDIVIPGTDSSGRTINVSWTIKNNTTATLANSSITDRILLSANPSFTASGSTELKKLVYATGQLLAGATLTKQASVTLPDGISGNYYIYIQTDFTNAVFETSENNNISRSNSPIVIALSPWADLQVTAAASATDTATAGDIISIFYKTTNKGIKPVNNLTWNDKIYFSLHTQWDSAKSIFIREMSQSRLLLRDSSYQVNTSIRIPHSFADTVCYAYIRTDAGNTIYEHTDEGNNIRRSNAIYVKKYPPIDLVVTAVSAPDSGRSGNPIKIKWTVENKGQAITLQNQWEDALFLSADTIWDHTDRFVKEFIHTDELAVGHNYTNEQNFILPDGVSGTYYLLLVTDRSDQNKDVNRNNNYKLIRKNGSPAPIEIILTPPPDLTITSLIVPIEGTGGQPVKIKWTVKNAGTGPTVAGSWTEKVYLSTNLQIDVDDQVIGTYVRSGVMTAGTSYTDSLQVFLPISASGNYVVIFKTDANDNVYEHGAEENTTTRSITITQAPLSDLIVSAITIPAAANAGDTITIQWKIKNAGINPAIGYMQQGIYLSTDTVKDAGDLLMGSPSTSINLAPQAEKTHSFVTELKKVSLRNYYALVHTDILNNISETSDSNNISASFETIMVTIPVLPMNVLTPKDLPRNKEVYYRIEIPDSLAGESLLVMLKGDSARGNNELFLRFGEVPTRAVYDFSFNEPYKADQEIIVPELQAGTYYLMVYGSAFPLTVQPVSLLATILNFEIRSVDAVQGGNTGAVTILVKGSKLDGIAEIRLRNANKTIAADSVGIADPTRVFASFNLSGAPLGIYDVVAKNTQGDTAVLEDGFTIVPGSLTGLITNVAAPPNTRISNVTNMTVQFTNGGNTDLINPVLKLVSLSGAPIAFTTAGLAENKKELILALQELDGPIGILRPGARGTIIIYTKALTPLGFMLLR